MASRAGARGKRDRPRPILFPRGNRYPRKHSPVIAIRQGFIDFEMRVARLKATEQPDIKAFLIQACKYSLSELNISKLMRALDRIHGW
jgi:hypothetical protein